MGMAEEIVYRHTVTNKIKRSSNAQYMAHAGFEPWDGEIERDKRGVQTAHLTYKELQDEAREQGLPTSGTKAEIQERLAIAQNTPTTPPETPGASSSGAADSSSTPAGEDSATPQKEG